VTLQKFCVHVKLKRFNVKDLHKEQRRMTEILRIRNKRRGKKSSSSSSLLGVSAADREEVVEDDEDDGLLLNGDDDELEREHVLLVIRSGIYAMR
jgi:hypothetical protein